MRITKIRYSILQSIILLALIAGLLYLYLSIAQFAEKRAQIKPAKSTVQMILGNKS